MMAGIKYWDVMYDITSQYLCGIISYSGIVPRCARDNLRGQKSLGPLKISLEMAYKVIVPQKKIMSRSFLNSGTLIVITPPLPPLSKRGLTLVCNINIVYGNVKSENSQDYAQKP